MRSTGRVPLVTADHVAESRGLDNITFLTIDTEGHDSLVLLGARQLLSARRVRVLQFEYHERGLWGPVPFYPPHSREVSVFYLFIYNTPLSTPTPLGTLRYQTSLCLS